MSIINALKLRIALHVLSKNQEPVDIMIDQAAAGYSGLYGMIINSYALFAKRMVRKAAVNPTPYIAMAGAINTLAIAVQAAKVTFDEHGTQIIADASEVASSDEIAEEIAAGVAAFSENMDGASAILKTLHMQIKATATSAPEANTH